MTFDMIYRINPAGCTGQNFQTVVNIALCLFDYRNNQNEGFEMKKLMKFMDSLERMMAASAFAEAGCWDAADALMNEGCRLRKKGRLSHAKNRPAQRPVMRA